MKLSIITVNYNNYDGLRRTAQSIVGQTYRDFEWIVIDGGSTDGSLEIIKSYAEHITYWVSEPDKGIYNAMNKGIAHANSEEGYFLFLNSGDIFCSPKSLERAVSYPWDSDIVAFDEFLDDGKYLKNISSSPQSVNYFRLLIGSLFHQSTFIKKSLLSQGYDEEFHIISDLIFWFEQLIVNDATYKCYNIPITLFDSTGVGSQNSPKRMKELHDYQGQYFNNKIRVKIKKSSTPIDAIEAEYMFNGYKKIIIAVYNLLMHLYLPFHFVMKLYLNIRYINRKFINA